MPENRPYYITTPIYYVNDAPHIGHIYTTLLADVLARAQRLIRGNLSPVHFLTGTDEHADKVVTSAEQHGKSTQEWADLNAARFRAAFEEMGFSNDDFIRTSEERHKTRATEFIAKLRASGAVELKDYTGWYDEGQEEYVPENEARERDYKSAVSGKPLVKRSEKNYFFKLSEYEDRLKDHIEANAGFIRPEARKNEVLGRIRQGLNDVPISRAVEDPSAEVWGIRMPGDDGHRVYVWIDALFNYLTALEDKQDEFWPADVQLVGKDILWFHAVIWPCMLMALDMPLPHCVYAHGWWVSEGKKMSKSMGNFIDLPTLRGYADRYSLDAVKWYLATQGPLGANDADFAYARFVEVYNAELANSVGNSMSRVGNMVDKYFSGVMPTPSGEQPIETALYDQNHEPPRGREFDWNTVIADASSAYHSALSMGDLDAASTAGRRIVSVVDQYIADTRPFTIAKELTKEPTTGLYFDLYQNADALAYILYQCAEALRIASLLLSPFMPDKMKQLWDAWDCHPPEGVPLEELAVFGGEHGLKPGHKITKGEALFMRAKPDDPAPEPIERN
ncbi:MAG: methionine--tRNA ligase [Planctomycetota bacterium]